MTYNKRIQPSLVFPLANSHQPTRLRKKKKRKFKSAKHAHGFLSAFGAISPQFQPPRHCVSARGLFQLFGEPLGKCLPLLVQQALDIRGWRREDDPTTLFLPKRPLGIVTFSSSNSWARESSVM